MAAPGLRRRAYDSSKSAERTPLGGYRNKVEDLGGSNPTDLPPCCSGPVPAAIAHFGRSGNRQSTRPGRWEPDRLRRSWTIGHMMACPMVQDRRATVCRGPCQCGDTTADSCGAGPPVRSARSNRLRLTQGVSWPCLAVRGAAAAPAGTRRRSSSPVGAAHLGGARLVEILGDHTGVHGCNPPGSP